MANKAMNRPAPGRGPIVPVARMEHQQFARRLLQEMQKRGWNQADLARAAFGKTHDSRGYNVAKGRDRISVYLRGLQAPDQKNLNAIAKALNMEPSELAPELFASAIDREHPEVMLNMVPGHADKAHLVVNKLVPMTVAAKIISMLSELDDE